MQFDPNSLFVNKKLCQIYRFLFFRKLNDCNQNRIMGGIYPINRLYKEEEEEEKKESV